MQLWKNLRYNVSAPFLNLTVQERFLQILRLVTASFALAFAIALLVGPLLTNWMYIARINCAHLDVAYGLYKSLRSSVSLSSTVLTESGAGNFPVDSSLTNSEIALLTQYAESQVANAPQYIITSLWSWCYGNYNETEYTDKHGNIKTKKQEIALVCSRTTGRYVFDYRDELKSIGLTSILAYAYQSSDYDDAGYNASVRRRHSQYKMVPNSIIFSGISQCILLVFTFIMYSNRGPEKSISKLPSMLLNFVALLSLASFISVAIGAGIITRMMIVIRKELSANLGDFGISVHMGTKWFSLLWLCTAFSLISTLSWTMPLWCANPSDLDEEYEEEFTFGTNNRNISGNRKTKMFSKLSMTGMMRHNQNEGKGLIDEIEHSEDSDSDEAQDHKEEELRRLGEKLSRNQSVRRINTRSNNPRTEPMITETAAKDILYNDSSNQEYNNYPLQSLPHYREETYDGYALNKAPSMMKSSNSLANLKAGSAASPRRESMAESYLNDDEVEYLDNVNFLNQYK
ncbi:SUR7/PalI family-domain-containing protein [Scheffersomyces xylosifermentans]|uniref:SUR7/PalI family-domain-containing protein n=1 Tax=Scheffersomyces xylosifermentans TaxID=1304137 RepID=UPI00315D58BD